MTPTMREQMAVTLNALFAEDPRLVMILADISAGYFDEAVDAFPGRVLNLGIMEQTAVSVAAGFALEGFIPVFHSIAPFAVERPYEQWKDDFGYQGLGGNVISVGASYDYGTDGMTHYAPGDVRIMLSVPGMEVVVPGTAAEFDTLFRQSYADGAPTYYRLSAQPNGADRPVQFSRLDVVQTGSQATVVAVGPMLDRAMEAVRGLDVTVTYCTTVSPFDESGLRAASRPGADGVHRIVLVEPYLEGTMSHAVVSALRPDPVRIECIGVPRRVLSRYGSPDEHDAEVGLTAAGIRHRVKALLAN
jgi:transketolase